MRRSSSLHSIDDVIDRNIVNDKYEEVVLVGQNIDDVVAVADTVVPNIDEILAAGSDASGGAAAAALSEANAAISESNAATSEMNSATSETNSAISEGMAQEWAENPEDIGITGVPGSFSSLHHAAKSLSSATAAALSETNAAISLSNIGTSEANALASANSASTSETNAATSEANADTSEAMSQEWAEKAEDIEITGNIGSFSSLHHAANSAASASAALVSEGNAFASEGNASTSEMNALASANAAALSETAAGTSEINAAASEAAAFLSESTAASSEADALVSETNAATSEGMAQEWAEQPENVGITDNLGSFSSLHHAAKSSASASASALSETNAATSESNADTSETNALFSANNASTSETKALASENAAALSETNAGISEINAGTSETNAGTSEAMSQEWAEKLEDIEITGNLGSFSSLHHAAKSATSAAAALASEGSAATSENNASTSAAAALVSEGLADADAIATAADRVQTGLDAAATAADLVSTNQDTLDTAADVVLTNADVVTTDTNATTSTTQAGISADNAGYAEEWAINLEDTLVSVAAGGNGTTDYSSLHHSAKSAASAGNAATSEGTASAAAVSASTSEGNAATSAANASGSASAASTSAANALDSENAAALSETAAGTSENNAAGSASAALDSETAALASQNAAFTSEANALASENAAASIYDSYDDRYLGAKEVDPTVDNDGSTLIIGATYWNTSTDELKFWNGAIWEDPSTAASQSAADAADSAAAALVSEGLADADAIATASDRVQTGLDATATADDLVATNQDTLDTAADLALTNADVVTTGNNAATSTTQAGISTDNAGYSEEWAVTIEDTLVSVAAGGDGTTDYSSLHHAAKASASAATATTQAGIATTKANEASADAAQVALDLVATNQDTLDTAADVVLTNADAAATAQDALDTAADLVATAQDVIDSAANAAASIAAEIDWQGDWVAGAYAFRDAVAYLGSSYVANKDTSETPSDVALDWDILAVRGADGAGVGDMLAADYDAGTWDNIHSVDSADTVLGKTVLENVPSGAVFTDTTYLPADPGTNGTDGVDGLLEDSDKFKLDNIESGSTADQTGAEIKSLYEAELNAFTDTLFTKLGTIEDGATADQTDVEISALMKDYAEVLTNKDITDPSNHVHARRLDLEAKNTSEVLIPAGTPVTFTEVNGLDNYEIVSTDQATGFANAITAESIDIDAIGTVVLSGRCPFDSSAYVEGQVLYVGAGVLTPTEPTTGYSQPIAVVLRDTIDGVVQVLAAYPKQSSDDVRYSGATSVEDKIGTMDTAIDLNTAKTTNVTTNLSTTHNASTVVVNSSDGTNATINAATATTAGIMTEAMYDQHVINNAKVSDINHNVSTNLSTTTTTTSNTIVSSDGTNAVINEATGAAAGLMSTTHHDKLDGIEAGADVNVGTNLSWTAGTTSGPTVNSSTGTNAVIPSASGTASGAVTTGAQTFAGVKTFSSIIGGSIDGNAATATNSDKLDGYDSSRMLIQKTDIPADVDLNDYIVTGLYHQNANASTAAPAANYPVELAGLLEVVEDGNMIYQTYTLYNSGIKFSRSKYSTTWYGWREQASTLSNVASASTATTLTGLTSTVAELNYVDGVTSNIQTQLAARTTKPSDHTANNVEYSGVWENNNGILYTSTSKWTFNPSLGRISATAFAGNGSELTNVNAATLGGASLSTNTALGTSNTLIPSQNAVRAYVDAAAGGGGSGLTQYYSGATNAGVSVTLANVYRTFIVVFGSSSTRSYSQTFTSIITVNSTEASNGENHVWGTNIVQSGGSSTAYYAYYSWSAREIRAHRDVNGTVTQYYIHKIFEITRP